MFRVHHSFPTRSILLLYLGNLRTDASSETREDLLPAVAIHTKYVLLQGSMPLPKGITAGLAARLSPPGWLRPPRKDREILVACPISLS